MRQVISGGSALGVRLFAVLTLVLGTAACGGDPAPGGGGGDAGDDGGGPGTSGGDGAVDGGADGGDGGEGGTNANGGTNGGTTGPRPNCGNAVLDDGEACDDGNQQNGDGCTDMCELEEGFECPELGARCEECGNGIAESSEGCDDGNRDNGDGCNADCDIEDGAWACPVDGEPCELCGDGNRDPNERCDDGNTASGDGCSDMCRSVDQGYQCPTAGVLCSQCGNNVVEPGEACDDGNRVSDDGCVGNCRAVEFGWACPDTGGSCTLCGDGVKDAVEECDDGNYRANDGCTSCMLDDGAVCLVDGAACSVCGNGVIEPTAVDGAMTTLEECDDGNRDNNDGCSDTCIQDPAYDCVVPGVTCSLCGDGVVSGFESCDDGRHCVGGTDAGDVCVDNSDCESNDCAPVSLDGCDDTCQAEENYVCPTDGGPCVECGNGIREGDEACDDGNVLGGDGCTRRCSAVEDGYTCLENSDGLSLCAQCGNGIVEELLDTDSSVLLSEACDDGNDAGEDGCSATCDAITEGYNCFFPGFPCAECGDGDLQPGEQCDEGTNTTGGCDAECQVVPPYVCPVVGAACALCGDGNFDPIAEECDDNNLVNSDGCSAECEIEEGYVCDSATGTCDAASCGDGFRAGDEECDDGNNRAGDGCSFVCDVEDGFVCDATGCRRTECGDGVTEGAEECDDGSVCAGGSEDTNDCTASDAACVTGGGVCAPTSSDGCSSTCELELGYECPPGEACVATTCGDGEVRGAEQCDDSGRCTDTDAVCTDDGECPAGTCEPQAGDGCGVTCQLEAGYYCPVAGAPCETTACGDGLVQGLEACDDGSVCSGGTEDGLDCTGDDTACTTGGGTCAAASGDGCDASCAVENLYRCSGEPSSCNPIIEFVAIRKFNVENVAPDGMAYDPERRSFSGHKKSNTGGQVAIELCLDGTILNQADNGFTNGTAFLPNNTEEELPASYEPPYRPAFGSLAGATYDPFTGSVLFLQENGTLTEIFSGFPTSGTALANVQEALPAAVSRPRGMTVGEDGNLYVVNEDTEEVFLIEREASECIGGANDGAACDVDGQCDSLNCSAQEPGVNNTSFDMANASPVSWSYPVNNPLSAIFTVPGEGLLGTFTTPTSGALRQCVGGTEDGTNCTLDATACTGGGGTCSTLPQFAFWDPDQLPSDPFFESSTLEGLLFSFGLITDDALPYSTSSEASEAETAADGGAFIICSRNSSAPCLLFARGCQSDAECQAVQPGTSCIDPGNGGQPYCAAEGRAIDDRTSVGSEEQDVVIDVLANDTLSESACIDPELKVVALTGADGVTVDDRFCTGGGTNDGANCVGEPFLCDATCGSTGIEVTTAEGGTATITNGGADITYDAPTGVVPSCGFLDTFEYTADLGGGVLDTAVVRILVACECGDGLVQRGEQCDCGDGTGDLPGSCTEANGVLPARCSDTCLLNIVCGDAIIDPGEGCDNGKHCIDNPDQSCSSSADCGGAECLPLSGDGCSSLCTLESVCGNGAVEGVEECDDGNTVSGDGCNANCTEPFCGDGVTDADNDEQCDDGLNNGPLPAACGPGCVINTVCGNGTIEGFEECDDGNVVPGDGCDASCSVEGACGNGDIDTGLGEECDPAFGGAQCAGYACTARCICANYCGDGRIGGTEDCDDGNTVSGDGCTADCVDEFCGDNVTQGDLGEQCDDGNSVPDDGCTNDCRAITTCGNAILDSGEDCDDGNNVSGDGCSSACETETTVCGDDMLDFDEQCDDGNNVSGDGCSATCLIEGAVCGDGVLESAKGEECDDGNTVSGDGCSDLCTVELI